MKTVFKYVLFFWMTTVLVGCALINHTFDNYVVQPAKLRIVGAEKIYITDIKVSLDNAYIPFLQKHPLNDDSMARHYTDPDSLKMLIRNSVIETIKQYPHLELIDKSNPLPSSIEAPNLYQLVVHVRRLQTWEQEYLLEPKVTLDMLFTDRVIGTPAVVRTYLSISFRNIDKEKEKESSLPHSLYGNANFLLSANQRRELHKTEKVSPEILQKVFLHAIDDALSSKWYAVKRTPDRR